MCSYLKDKGCKGMESLKYIVVLGDGMAGLPLETLGGQTTLEYARTPAMDLLAGKGEVGLACMVPPDMKISDIQGIMNKYKIHSVLVVDRENRLLGVVDHYSCML